MGQLSTLVELTTRREKTAQSALFAAQVAHRICEQELASAQSALEEYVRLLPEHIARLYAPVMLRHNDVPTVEAAIQAELELTKKADEYRAKVIDATSALERARQALANARQVLAKAQQRKMGIDELVKQDKQQQFIASERALSKILDEFAGNRYTVK